jgi:hypothetical protein
MRRIVIGLVVAAIMLMPAVGMAAAPIKQPSPVSFWQAIVQWVSQAVGLEKSQPTPSPSPSGPGTTAPIDTIDAGSTIDPNQGGA